MKARLKDTGEIIELAEEGIISHDGRRYCWHQVELLPEPVDEVQPSLPSSLDKAAEEYGRNTFINECMENGVCDDHDLSDAFKAGAEWRDAQIPKLPDNVDEAAFAYENAQWEAGIKDCGYCPQDVYDAFKAGAAWRDAQIPKLPDNIDAAAEKAADEVYTYTFQHMEDLIGLFKAGAAWMRAKLLEDAVEGEVENASFGIVYLRKNLTNDGYSTGDKVRIIILLNLKEKTK